VSSGEASVRRDPDQQRWGAAFLSPLEGIGPQIVIDPRQGSFANETADIAELPGGILAVPVNSITGRSSGRDRGPASDFGAASVESFSWSGGVEAPYTVQARR
jgi:hypothetical protein